MMRKSGRESPVQYFREALTQGMVVEEGSA
jgi:hypothetical protein